MKKSIGKDWKLYAKMAVMCMVLSASAILGLGVKSEATVISKYNSGVSGNSAADKGGSLLNMPLPAGNSLKSATNSTIIDIDGTNVQVAFSRHPITTNNVNSVDNNGDFTIYGKPAFSLGSTVYLNLAVPEDSVEVVHYDIDCYRSIYNRSGECISSARSDLGKGDVQDGKKWYRSIKLPTDEIGHLEYFGISITCANGITYRLTYNLDNPETKYLYFHFGYYIYGDRTNKNISHVKDTYTEMYGSHGFYLGPKRGGGYGGFSYKSSNKKVADINRDGLVTAKGYGTAKITIVAEEDFLYFRASKTVTINVVPQTVWITKISSPSKGRILCTWKKDSTVTGYEIHISSKEKNLAVKTKKPSVKGKVKSKEKYSVTVRAYKTVGGKKYYGEWSSTKTITAK